jgi:hypothetical protein
MDKMSKFGSELRKLLIYKIKTQKLNIPIDKVKHTRLNFQIVNEKLKYFIDSEIVDQLSKEDIKEIESLWNSFKIG